MSIYLGRRKVELKNQNIPKIDTSKLIKSDGSVSMASNLDLGNYAIDNLKTYPERSSNATSKKYVDDETAKLLDLDANRQMKGDLDLGDNSILAVLDISADNSVPSKKFVKDEDKKLNTKISTNKGNITRNKNEISTLESAPRYSHYSFFLYQNPSSSLWKYPFITPAGYPGKLMFFSQDLSDKTEVRILGIVIDRDTIISGSVISFTAQIEIYDNLGGNKTAMITDNRNVAFDRINTEQFRFRNEIKFNFKTGFPADYTNFQSFLIKIKTGWTGNETALHFCVDY